METGLYYLVLLGREECVGTEIATEARAVPIPLCTESPLFVPSGMVWGYLVLLGTGTIVAMEPGYQVVSSPST